MRALLAAAMLACAVSSAAAAPSYDATAWNAFATLTAPTGGGKPVAFETWASDSDIYGGTPAWPKPGSRVLARSLAASAEAFAMHGTSLPAAACQPADPKAGNFPPGACIGEMVQHNRPVFDAIVNAHLTSTAGLVKAFAGKVPIAFPKDSIVVKADWVAIPDLLHWLPQQYKTAAAVRRAYYTNTAILNGRAQEYALLGMSVQSKDLPDWLWMTFEHRSNPGRCDVIGCHDGFGAAQANVDPRVVPNTDYGPCAKTPALAALFKSRRIDPVFANYCLKGTQAAFTTPPSHKPTVLANSVIERMNKGVAVAATSCITCHAYASFDVHGTPNYAVLPKHPVGAPDPKVLAGFKTHDYLWSILAAH
ncbi:MAG TPA: hypothetical protein VG387_06340 [Rhizomicrobium sp.]|jgi:hypothetical protein|nr:hypothetical protein [Rhizomicrobium sp.]